MILPAINRSDDDIPAASSGRWAWVPLGAGMDSDVLTLTVYENNRIAGGNFTAAGGGVVNYIAAWGSQ